MKTHRIAYGAAALAAVLFLTGCETIKEVKVPVEVVRTRTVYPDENLLRDCPIVAPLARQAYLKLNDAGKEKALAIYANANVSELGKCNQDKRSLREWVKRQKAKEAQEAKDRKD